ncbi:hypothetical protein TWF694_011635 [Orbilia ellipsospora]|uniref:Protein kinase domain-containing protein n=1 Tax=Orbilia ellipsospora TaxID=2528407 RepID=A0AAV9X8E9_9PEZI
MAQRQSDRDTSQFPIRPTMDTRNLKLFETDPAEGEKLLDSPVPNYAFTSSAKKEASYLSCCLKLQDSLDEPVDHATLPEAQRQKYAAKIIELMSTWNESRTQPLPLNFIVDENENITLQRFEGYAITSQVIPEYEPHFWIPDSCLVGLEEQDKTFRREFFAVGCLLYQILKGEKPWGEFSDDQARRLYENGVYPSGTPDLLYWNMILSYWSWEYVVEVTKKNKIKKATNIIKKVAIGTTIAGGVVLAVGLCAPLILPAIGFGAAGVGAGTAAAAWQSAIGLVEAGSLFAVLQSAGAGGAAGAAAITAVGIGGASTAVTAGAAGIVAGTVEANALKDEDRFALFLTVVRKRPVENDAKM